MFSNLSIKAKEPIKQEQKELPKIETKQPLSNNVKDDREIIGAQSGLLIIDDDVAFSEIVYETIKKMDIMG